MNLDIENFPQEVFDAARLLERFFAMRGARVWRFLGVASRPATEVDWEIHHRALKRPITNERLRDQAELESACEEIWALRIELAQEKEWVETYSRRIINVRAALFAAESRNMSLLTALADRELLKEKIYTLAPEFPRLPPI